MRTFLRDVVAHGGLESPEYLTPERQADEDELRDLIEQVRSTKLRAALERLQREYHGAFGSAPPASAPMVIDLNRPGASFDTERMRARAVQRDRQVQHARAGLDAIADALTRVTKLEHLVAAA
jgi:hypothetical protein